MDADITIIGAGVIGLAVAAEVADSRQSVYIIEKNSAHGMGISSRNSEVVHAGIYYPPGSLKATLCCEGRELLYETCFKNRIPCRKIGKLIIAVTGDEMNEIGRLYQNARENGVPSVSLLDRTRILQIEPNITAAGALYSHETGIVSAHLLMDYYLNKAGAAGGEIVYGTTVTGITRVARGYRVATVNSASEYFEFTTETIVNAAGLQSDVIGNMAGKTYKLHYCKGDYFSINNVRKDVVRRLIYPVPEKNHVGLGVHLTLDLNGRMKLGPDACYIDRKEDYRVEENKRDRFYESAVRFLPFIRKEDITPDMSGIRPKLQAGGQGFRDFVISEDLPGFINLVGIESPGLTAAPAIARYVKRLLAGRAST